jgi:hypothetical protein
LQYTGNTFLAGWDFVGEGSGAGIALAAAGGIVQGDEVSLAPKPKGFNYANQPLSQEGLL